MTTPRVFTWQSVGLDKQPLQTIVAAHYQRLGLPQEPSLTAEQLQARMRANGVRPEDNLASCGIIAARDEEA